MNKRWIGLGLVFVLFLAAVMLNRNEVQLQSQNPFQLRRLSSAGFELSSFAAFYNPNLLSSTIVHLEEKCYVNGRQVGILSLDMEQGIPGRKTTTFPIALRIPANNMEGLITGEVNEKVVVEVTGEIGYRNFTGGGKIVVEIRDSIEIVNQ